MINLLKKIVAFDLDGTLAESKQLMTKEMAGLVKDLAKDIKVAIISGATFKQFDTQFLPAFSENDLSSFVENLILLPTSGSQRYEYNLDEKEWKLTDIELFPEEIKEKVKKVLKEIIDSGLYDIPSNPNGEYIEDRITQISISALGQNAPIEQKKLWDPDQKKRQQIIEVLYKKLPEVSLIIGGTTTIDVLPKGFDKAKGLTRFISKVNLSKTDMVFVGDSIFPGGNDYSVSEAGIESIKVSGPTETREIIKKWITL